MNAGRCKGSFKRKPLAVAIALLVVAPGIALSEPLFQVPLYGNADMTRYETNNVELGIGYNDVSGDAYKFGEFSGLYKSDPFAIGNFNWATRDLGTGGFGNAWGWNLGLPSRQLGGAFGTQGKWDVNAHFQQITHYQTDSTRFVHQGLGSGNLTLPAGFAGISAGNSQPPANVTAINNYLDNGYGIKVDRDFLKIGGGYAFGGSWELTGKYDYQKREGANLIGAVMGSNGGNPRAALVPAPVNDNTQQFDIGLRYTSDVAQFNISYWYSKYSNDESTLTWQNPFANQTGLWQAGSGVGFPTGFGRMSLAPDNDFQQVQATGAYNFTPTTRLTGTFSYGVGRQDQAYDPYTINVAPLVTPGLLVPRALPQGSLDGKLENTLVDLTLTTRPIARLNLRLNYHYNDHANKTPENQYLYVGGDVVNQPVVPPGQSPNQVASGAIRVNLPPGTTENKFTVDTDYPIARGTSLRGWYTYLKTDYSVGADELRYDTNVNTLGVELRSRANQLVSGYVKYQYDQRRGSDFDQNRPYDASYTPAQVAASPFDNLPTLRQYYVADYDQNGIKANASVTPSGPVTFSLQANWYERKYRGPDCGGPNDQVLPPPAVMPSQCQGLQNQTGQSYTLDAQYVPMEAVNLYAFYTWSQLEQNQDGRSYSGGANQAAQSTDTNRNWSINTQSADNAVGIGGKYAPADKPYDVGFQYLYSAGVTSTSPLAAAGLTNVTTGAVGASAVPDVKNTLNSFQLFGKYKYSKNLLFRANYWYQHLRADNWAYDNATPTSSNNVLLNGQQTPNYTANVFGISFAYTNW